MGFDMNTIGSFFRRGDLLGAMAYIKKFPELSDMYAAYEDLFVNGHYLTYDADEEMNRLLLPYQQYFRDIFYLKEAPQEAEARLFSRLFQALGMNPPDGDEDTRYSALTQALQQRVTEKGYHIVCGQTCGYYGPYIWKNTQPRTYTIELPSGIEVYRLNILSDFLMCSWGDYLTFGQKCVGGWTDPDGVLNCVEKAYDFHSEDFTVSLLKHEAQHAYDFKRWPGMEIAELEYRAKLVELIYSSQRNLLPKFYGEADATQARNSHTQASYKLSQQFRREYGDVQPDCIPIPRIQATARRLYEESENDNAARRKPASE